MEYRSGVRSKKERAVGRGKIKSSDVVDDDDSMLVDETKGGGNKAVDLFQQRTGRRKAGKVKVIEEAQRMRAGQKRAVMYSNMTLEEVYKAEVRLCQL